MTGVESVVEGDVGRAILPLLRSATQEAHRTLERQLDLLNPVRSLARVQRLLAQFEHFHRVWEPRVEALIDHPAFLTPRRRHPLLQADLAAMGVAPNRGPAPNLSWLDGSGAAWGSLYVLEGSTLGGQVIEAALAAQAGSPASGLTYFNDRGRRTGALWRETKQVIESHAKTGDPDQMVVGAVRAFETLIDWLAPTSEARGA